MTLPFATPDLLRRHIVALLLGVVCLAPASLGAQHASHSPVSLDVRGAWRMDDGGLVSLYRSDASDTGWRFVDFRDGASHRLYPRDSVTFTSSDGWTGNNPVRNTYTIALDGGGNATSLTLRQGGGSSRRGRRIPVREDTVTFKSGGITLFGKLVRPATGAGPWPVLIFVHGSDNAASVDRTWDPYLFASNGVAMFTFDKRGTGRSGGEYTQLFSVLSDDVVAATRWVHRQKGIDTMHIGLAGFSQGGWVAPLASSKDPGIRFLLVGYGMTMSVAEEDRLESPLKLRERGFGDRDVREFEELNTAIHRAAESRFANGWGEIEAKMAQYHDRPWMQALPTMETWAGSILKMGIDRAKAVVPTMFQTFIDPFYDSVPTLERLNIPVLWLIAGADIEAPPGPTIVALEKLRKSGKNVQVRIFPHTDHGMTEFTVNGSRRTRTRYAPQYFRTMVRWVAEQVRR